LVDGLTEVPKESVRVVAKTIDQTNDLTCMARESTTTGQGVFTLKDLCRGLRYGLSIPDPSLQLSGQLAVTGGEASEEVVDHTIWRAPNGPGLYRLADDKLTRIRTWADVDSAKILGSSEVVRYPMMKPTPKTKLVNIGPGNYLVISGAYDIKRLQFHPLIPGPGRRAFVGTTITNHVYIGVRFSSDTVFKRMRVTLDQTKVSKVLSGKHAYHYLGHEALPAGRYAVLSDKDNVTYLVDFSR
jgi:hypothetical protein